MAGLAPSSARECARSAHVTSASRPNGILRRPRGSVDNLVIPAVVRVEEGNAAFPVGQLCVNAEADTDRMIAPHLVRRTDVERLRKLLASHGTDMDVAMQAGGAAEVVHPERSILSRMRPSRLEKRGRPVRRSPSLRRPLRCKCQQRCIVPPPLLRSRAVERPRTWASAFRRRLWRPS